MFAKGVRDATEVRGAGTDVSVWSRLICISEPIKMTAQCTLVSQLERPVLSNLLLDVEQKLLGVTGLMADRVRERGARRKIGDCAAAGARRRVGPGQIGIAVRSGVESVFVYVTRPAMLRAMSKYALPISWV